MTILEEVEGGLDKDSIWVSFRRNEQSSSRPRSGLRLSTNRGRI